MQKVYLDQNKWIELARSYHNRTDNWDDDLNLYMERAKSGHAVFPLSSAHVIETNKAGDLDRRGRLAEVMVLLSKGVFVAPPSVVQPYELECAVAETFEVEVSSSQPQLYGTGIEFAFGEEPIEPSEHLPVPLQKRFRSIIESPAVVKLFLQGVQGLENLNTQGRKAVDGIEEDYAKSVEAFRGKAEEYSQETRYRAHIGNLLLAEQEKLLPVLAKDLTIDDVLELGPEGIANFIRSAPTYDVEISLATQRNEHHDREADKNDMIDLGFLGMAIPYCDVVITENFWADLAKRERLGDKYNTLISGDLEDLTEIL